MPQPGMAGDTAAITSSSASAAGAWRGPRRRMRLRIPPLVDMLAVQLARARVRYGLAAGRISPSESRLFFFALRMAADNLRFLEQQECWREEELELSPLRCWRQPLSPIGSIKYVELYLLC